MPVYPSGGTIAQSVGSPGFGPAPTPVFNASASVRFNPADTPSFGYIPTLQGSRTTFTLSVWAKRSLLGAQQMIFGVNADTNNHLFFEFQANDTLRIASNTASSTVIQLITTQFFRDPSQWYNIVIVFDLTNATQADRVSLFVNGVRVTAFSTSTLPANTTTITTVNTAGIQHYIGRYAASSTFYYGGYLADMNLVDGLALTPSSFTATDANTGQLVPAQYTGNRGTNGFYLPFSSATLAVDLGQNPKTTAKDFPYWPYNTLLVDTTSTNGAQNNTFLDSSTNNFTVTRNGNTTQGNFTPFTFGGGTTQANGYYSGYFDGTGDYLSLPASGNASYINGTGNFTIDFWVYYNALPTGSVGANTGCSWYAQDSGLAIVSPFNLIQAGNTWYLYADTGAGTWNIFSQVTIATTTLSSGQWYHVACVRDSTNIRLYINGVQVGTASIGAASIWQNTVRNLYLFGAWQNTAGSTGLNGYVSNYRLVKGTCLYPNGTTFTVPTTPLTAITNTSLLTCQSSQFIDNSTNAFAITANGNAQPLPTNPFGMTAWSGYFDGTGDYLTVANNAALDPNTDSFCMECWVYITGTTGNNQGFNGKGVAGTSGYSFYITNALLLSFIWNGTGGATITGGTLSLNTWNHVAVVRNSGVIRLYLNGVGAASSTACTTDINSTNGLFIGQARGGNPILGNMSNYRMTKGTLPPGYDATTSTLPVPTAPLTAISGTSLLTCQSSTFVDNSTNAFPITVFGNSYTGTLNNPFGNPINYTTPPVQAWSTYFDGSGDYISSPSGTPVYNLGTGLWTWEAWINTNSTATIQTVWFYYTTNVDAISTTVNGSTGVVSYSVRATNRTDTTTNSPSGSIRLNQWHHLAMVRDSGTNITCYIDGKAVGVIALASNASFQDPTMFTGNPTIGAKTNAVTNYFSGYISNVRFVRGSAVYTGNFTPPTAPLTAIPGTMTLASQSNRVLDNSILNAAQVANGNTSISPVSPFIPTQAWSAASYGGTMFFDGTGDYLSIADNATLEFGSSDFTIEAFIYPTATVGANRPIWSHGTNSTNWMSLYLHTTAGRPEFVIISGGSTIVDIWPADVISPNIWYHLAVTRSGSTFRMFLNGALIGTGTNASAVPDYTDDYRVGYGRWSGDTGVYAGNISGLRILKGTALYTTPFVPPVLPPTNISSTSLLLNATNAGIYDATGQNVIETVGNAQVTTAVKKFGESSISFDGSGDYLQSPNSNQFNFGSSDFTIEFWMYASSQALAPIVHQTSYASNQGWVVWNYDGANIGTSTRRLTFMLNGTGFTLTTSSDAYANNTWTHIAVVKLGTASNNIKIYSNGVSIASGTYATAVTNATTPFFIGGIINGVSWNGTAYYSGYLQDVRITRGVARYQGNFTPPAAAFAYNQYDIGNQQWLPTNISVTAGIDQDNLVDSPSDYGTDTGLGGQVRGNYCTWNPLKNSTALSNGNLSSFNSSTSQWLGVAGTFGMTSGKWYWECTPIVADLAVVGLANSFYNTGGHPGADANSWGYFSFNGNKYFNNSGSAYGATYTANNVIGVAFDADAGTLTFYKNGVSQGVAFSGLTSGPYFPACGVLNSQNLNINAGQRAFAHTAPAGYKCLVSTNLPTPTIGATSSTRADDYFNPALYTGTGASLGVTGVGFQPDLVWVKGRSGATNHGWYDAVRGVQKQLESNTTAAETTQTTGLTAFGSDGFTVGSLAQLNTSAATYVAWNWKANGAGVANTAGTIPSTVSANTTSGCSIVTYTGNGVSGATIGHGLGAVPSFIIVKNRNTTAKDWECYHVSLGNTNRIRLNVTAAADTGGTMWANTTPTSTVFSVGVDADVNASTLTYVAYCFAPISGFSAMGSYTGTATTDGPMIYTNFRPAYVLIKRSSAIESWCLMDSKREGYNVDNDPLFPNLTNAEGTQDFLDLLSNGFKLRSTDTGVNGSGTYIYIAFAESPFKYSRAR